MRVSVSPVRGAAMLSITSTRRLQWPVAGYRVRCHPNGAFKRPQLPYSAWNSNGGSPSFQDTRCLRKRRLPKRKSSLLTQSSLCVDPSLPLLQQPAVHSAFGQCALAIVTSFLAASLLSALLEKAANKVTAPCMTLHARLGSSPAFLQVWAWDVEQRYKSRAQQAHKDSQSRSRMKKIASKTPLPLQHVTISAPSQYS